MTLDPIPAPRRVAVGLAAVALTLAAAGCLHRPLLETYLRREADRQGRLERTAEFIRKDIAADAQQLRRDFRQIEAWLRRDLERWRDRQSRYEVESQRNAPEVASKNAYAWNNLEAVFDLNGQAYDAVRAYKNSLECNLQQPVVLVNLATVYLNQERWGPARRTLQKAIELDPNLSVARARMGYLEWCGQRYDQAAETYAKAIELDPKSAAAHAEFGVVRMTQYLNRPEEVAYRDEAIESWHRSLEINPDQPQLRALIEQYRVRKPKPILSLDG